MIARTLHQIGQRDNRHIRVRAGSAFTLIEVILAIVIALGILVVLLYFYQQATNLRAQAIQETERIAAARLIMDRITSELRTMQPESMAGLGFSGSSNSIQFINTEVPSFSSWTGGTLGRSTSPVTDLRVVRYRLESLDGTNVAGLLRSEEPMVTKHLVASADQLDQTNALANAVPPPLFEEIRFLQFRYWSGTNWQDSWNLPGAPEGVEISLGAEPVTNGTDMAEYPAEIFRRVIYLAGTGLALKKPEPAASERGSRPAAEETP